MDDEARRVILARRARFVAAALAGAGLAVGTDACAPERPAEPRPAVYVPEPSATGGASDVAPPPRSDASPPPAASEVVAPPPEICLSYY